MNPLAKLDIDANAYLLVRRYGHKSANNVLKVIKVITILLKLAVSGAIKHRLHVH